MVKTPSSRCRGGGLIPGWGSSACHAGSPCWEHLAAFRLAQPILGPSAIGCWFLDPHSTAVIVTSRTHVGAPSQPHGERNFHSSWGGEADSRWSEQSWVPGLLLRLFLVSGLNEAQVPDVSWQKEFSERQSGR